MRRTIVHSFGILSILSLTSVGCVSIDPTPLVSDFRYGLGHASRVFHRDTSEVADAAKQALSELSFTSIRQTDGGWDYQYEAAAPDGRKTSVQVTLMRGSTEGDTLLRSGLISKVSVRVGPRGDREVSEEILDRIEDHLRRPTA